jgi:hypothetical protein
MGYFLGYKEGSQDIAQMVVCWGAILKQAETAQQLKLFDAEKGDIGETLGSGQHRDQAQKQDLRQRICHLDLLAWVSDIIEITEKDNCFVECLTARCSAVHCRPPPSESEDRYRFWVSPVCHVLLHPIALTKFPHVIAIRRAA